MKKPLLTPLCAFTSCVTLAALGGPAKLGVPVDFTNAAVHLTASGDAGITQVLELSTDLAHWMRLATTPMTGGTAAWDVPAGENALHAYRLRIADPSEIPSPLAIQTTVNSDFVRTSAVLRDGYTTKLTDDNGVIYQLTIPPNALFAEQDITFSVINTASGWPLSGAYLGGVQIEPAGIVLMAPATLTITYPGPLTNAIGLAWKSGGAEFHAHPSRADGNVMTIPLAQLGGYGIADLGSGDLATLRAHNPSGFTDQNNQQLALAARTPAGGGAGGGVRTKSSLPQSTLDAITHSFDVVVRPELEAAIRDDSLADLALAEYGMWRVGLDIVYTGAELADLAPLFNEAITLGGKAIYTGINRATDRCEQHQIQTLGRLVHFGQLMEVAPWSASFTSADLVLFRQKVKNCATFDIDLDATVEDTDPIGFGTSEVHSHWTIEFKDEALTQLTGAGSVPLEATYEVTQSPCSLASISPSPGGLQIPEFQLLANPRDLWTLTNRPTAANLSVLFNPFLVPPQENILVSCPPAGAIPLRGFWTIGFGQSYLDTLKKTSHGQIYRISAWNEGSDDVLGQKDDRFTVIADGQITLKVHAQWMLRHAPIPLH